MEYLYRGDAAITSIDTLYYTRIYRSREQYGIAYKIKDEKRRIKLTIKLSYSSSILILFFD